MKHTMIPATIASTVMFCAVSYLMRSRQSTSVMLHTVSCTQTRSSYEALTAALQASASSTYSCTERKQRVSALVSVELLSIASSAHSPQASLISSLGGAPSQQLSLHQLA